MAVTPLDGGGGVYVPPTNNQYPCYQGPGSSGQVDPGYDCFPGWGSPDPGYYCYPGCYPPDPGYYCYPGGYPLGQGASGGGSSSGIAQPPIPPQPPVCPPAPPPVPPSSGPSTDPTIQQAAIDTYQVLPDIPSPNQQLLLLGLGIGESAACNPDPINSPQFMSAYNFLFGGNQGGLPSITA